MTRLEKAIFEAHVKRHEALKVGKVEDYSIVDILAELGFTPKEADAEVAKLLRGADKLTWILCRAVPLLHIKGLLGKGRKTKAALKELLDLEPYLDPDDVSLNARSALCSWKEEPTVVDPDRIRLRED